jgi:hypothetical protein
MMKIKGREIISRSVEVEVNPVDAVKALKQIIYPFVKLPLTSENLYIANGKIYVDEEYRGGSHSSYETLLVADVPTDEQLEVIKLFAKLNTLAFNVMMNERE